MKYFYKIIIVALLYSPMLSSGSTNEELDYEFIQEGNNYSFRGSFLVKAKPESLISLIYNFKNISKYSLGAKSIELVQQGDDWYDVIFTYRKFIFFENQSTWRRTLSQDEQKVVFTLISSRNNLNILPKMFSSTGYYHIGQKKEGCLVEYYQECEITSGLLKDIYINVAKKEAIKFLNVLKEYLERNYD